MPIKVVLQELAKAGIAPASSGLYFFNGVSPEDNTDLSPLIRVFAGPAAVRPRPSSFVIILLFHILVYSSWRTHGSVMSPVFRFENQ